MKIDNEKVTATKPGKKEKAFKGYNLEQLRYQRAVVALKKEFAKEKMKEGLSSLKGNLPFQKKKKSSNAVPVAKSFLSKVVGGLSYVDYVIMGFSVINTGKKIFSFFRKKKK